MACEVVSGKEPSMHKEKVGGAVCGENRESKWAAEPVGPAISVEGAPRAPMLKHRFREALTHRKCLHRFSRVLKTIKMTV